MATSIRFKTKIGRARLVVSGLKQGDMVEIGKGLIYKIRDRMGHAQTRDDTTAPPLSPKYMKFKQKITPFLIRNLYLRGRLHRSIKVLRADQNKCTIGFSDDKAEREMFFNQIRSRQWGVSPSDKAELSKLVKRKIDVRITKDVATTSASKVA